MAFTNMSRENRFFQKKEECFFAAEVVEGTQSFEVPAATGSYILSTLPPDTIITDAYIHVEVASDAATSAVGTLGTADAGTEILSAADLATTGKQGTFTGQSLTGTGQELYLGITVTGAATTVGKYIVVVEYMEYRKNTGDYTKYSSTASTA